MRVVSKGLHLRYPDTRISVWGTNLHAPMAERILEIPIDVYDGERIGAVLLRASQFCDLQVCQLKRGAENIQQPICTWHDACAVLCRKLQVFCKLSELCVQAALTGSSRCTQMMQRPGGCPYSKGV